MEEPSSSEKKKLACPIYQNAFLNEGRFLKKCCKPFSDLAHVHEHLKKEHYGDEAGGIDKETQKKISDLFKADKRKMPTLDKWMEIYRLCYHTAPNHGPYLVTWANLFSFLDNPPSELESEDSMAVRIVRDNIVRVINLASIHPSGQTEHNLMQLMAGSGLSPTATGNGADTETSIDSYSQYVDDENPSHDDPSLPIWSPPYPDNPVTESSGLGQLYNMY